jgi:hypothetical protein
MNCQPNSAKNCIRVFSMSFQVDVGIGQDGLSNAKRAAPLTASTARFRRQIRGRSLGRSATWTSQQLGNLTENSFLKMKRVKTDRHRKGIQRQVQQYWTPTP